MVQGQGRAGRAQQTGSKQAKINQYLKQGPLFAHLWELQAS